MNASLYSCLSHRACKSHLFCSAFYFRLWSVWLHQTFSHYLIFVEGTIFKKNFLTYNCVVISLRLFSVTLPL